MRCAITDMLMLNSLVFLEVVFHFHSKHISARLCVRVLYYLLFCIKTLNNRLTLQ